MRGRLSCHVIQQFAFDHCAHRRQITDIAQYTAAIIVLDGTFGAVLVSTPLSPEALIEEILALVSLEQEASQIERRRRLRAHHRQSKAAALSETANVTEEGRARNRRCDIVILNQTVLLAEPAHQPSPSSPTT